MFLIGSSGVDRHAHVVEHAFQLLRKLITTLELELGEHSSFCIIGNRTIVEESFGEMRFVISFEDVLLRNEPKDSDSLVQNDIDFVIGFLEPDQQTLSTDITFTYALQTLL